MRNKDDEIKRKLDELEDTILKEQTSKADLTNAKKDPLLLTTSPSSTAVTKSDGYYFGGLLSIGLGLVILFQTVQVSSNIFSMFGFGGGGFGLLLIPLIVGMGWLMYDAKAKMAWLLTAVSCLIIVLSILGSLIMYIPRLPLLTMVMILFPLALGGALLLKGAGGPKAAIEEIKKIKS